MSKTSAERRRAKRVPARVPVRVTRPGASSQQAESRDLSRNGLFFFLGEPMAEGTAIELVMMLPNEVTDAGQQWVCCQGRVVRVESPTRPGAFGIAATFDRYTVVPEALANPK